MANPTTSGMQNHLSGAPRWAPDPGNPRRAIDAVFGADAQIIAGIPIEQGSGALPVEEQLAQAVRGVWMKDGAGAGEALCRKILEGRGVNRGRFRHALARNRLVTEAA